MNGLRCAREREISEVLERGQWPHACPAELRAHAASCKNCSDLVLVTRTLQAAKKQATGMPQLPSAGAVWWRAQLRRRTAAIETVGRPILGAEIFALVVVFVLGAAFLVWQGSAVKGWLHQLPGSLHLDALVPDAISVSNGVTWILLPVLATVVLVGGVVVYLSSEER